MISTEKKVNESVINYGLVNNILLFNKLSQTPCERADLTFKGNTMTLRPSPDGSFFYNLKEWISALFGAKGFTDVLNINIEDSGLVYDVTDFCLIDGLITIVFYKLDGTTETITNSVYFLNAVRQVEDFTRRNPELILRSNIFPLTPLDPDSNRKIYLDYWTGYPFDITIHKDGQDNETVFKNNDTLSEYVYNTLPARKIHRYVFSDGRDDINVIESMQLTSGRNNITVSSNGKSFQMVLNKIPLCKFGVYVKWLNSDGAYSYFLFDKGDRNRRTTYLGDLENDYENLETTVSPTVSIGKESNDVLRLNKMLVSPERQVYLNDLIESPAVFMFTGIPYNKNTFNDWLEIRLTSNDVRVANAKQQLNNYELIFELPKRNTRKR